MAGGGCRNFRARSKKLAAGLRHRRPHFSGYPATTPIIARRNPDVNSSVGTGKKVILGATGCLPASAEGRGRYSFHLVSSSIIPKLGGATFDSWQCFIPALAFINIPSTTGDEEVNMFGHKHEGNQTKRMSLDCPVDADAEHCPPHVVCH